MKQIYRKIQYRENVFWKFKGLPLLLKKLILCLLTIYSILKPWNKIPWLRRFDLAFDRLKNKFIGNSDLGRTISESFKVYLAFPEKWFCICPPNLVLWSLKPIFLGSEDSIKSFGRLQNKFIGISKMGRSSSESFKGYLIFPQKMVLYLLRKSGIFKTCTNIPLFRRFNLHFWKT